MGKRKIAILLLVFASSLPIFFSGAFLGSRLLIRIVMLERVEEENLTTLMIPEAEFKWYNIGHEIIVADQMFDVKSISLTNGIYTVKGLFDEDETELNKLEEDYTTNSAENSSKSPNSIFQSCLGIIGVLHTVHQVPEYIPTSLSNFYFSYSSSLLEGFASRNELPPDLVNV